MCCLPAADHDFVHIEYYPNYNDEHFYQFFDQHRHYFVEHNVLQYRDDHNFDFDKQLDVDLLFEFVQQLYVQQLKLQQLYIEQHELLHFELHIELHILLDIHHDHHHHHSQW